MKDISTSRLFGALGILIALPLMLGQTSCASIGIQWNPEIAGPHATTTYLATRGPTPIPEVWTSVASPPEAVALRFAPSDPLIVYACAEDGPPLAPAPRTPRLYTSMDGAMTWRLLLGVPIMRLVASSIPTFIVCSIFLSPSDPLSIFLQEMQTDPAHPGHALAWALYRSYDAGATWYPINTPHGSDGFSSLVVLKTRWIASVIPHLNTASACNPFSAAPRATSQVYASDDGGQTWRSIGQSIEAAGYSPRDIRMKAGLIFAIADRVPRLACQHSNQSTLWRSNDGGATWKRTLLAEPSIETISFAKGTVYYYGVATIAEGATMATLFSRNWGYTWYSVRGGTIPAHTHFINVAVAPDGVAMAQVAGGAKVYMCNFNDRSPQWVAVTPSRTTAPQTWRVVRLRQGTLLWSLAFAYKMPTQPSALAYLPLP